MHAGHKQFGTWLSPGGGRGVKWLVEGQPRGGDICEIADSKEAAKDVSLGPGLLEAWKGSGSLLSLVWLDFVELSAVHWEECIHILLLHLQMSIVSGFADEDWIGKLEIANELRRREYRELNTWSFTPLGNAFEMHLTHGVLNKPGTDI